MDALIDSVLETIMHSAIWRMTYHMEFLTLVVVAIVAFALLVYRRSRSTSASGSRRQSGYKYRRRYGRHRD